MKRELELRDLCSYFPYGLKVLYEHSGTATVEVISTGGGVQLCEKGDWRKYHIPKEIERCKPILRPLSDLYKTITHNGKEIIPIVECAKIAFDTLEWSATLTSAESVNPKGDNVNFDYSSRYSRFNFHSMKYEVAPYNQYQLFDFLHELKIDYRNLINSGLAIDANTLKANPYK
jgi:hypothetical protein